MLVKAIVQKALLEQMYLQWVTHMRVKVGATGAQFRFRTTFAETPIVVIYDGPPESGGQQVRAICYLFGGQRTTHELGARDLEQDRSYWFRVLITTPGNVRFSGSFRTGARTCAVVSEELRVLNDGDPSESGEMTFMIWAGDGNQTVGETRGFDETITSGQAIADPFPVLRLARSGGTIAIRVYGADDDTPPLGFALWQLQLGLPGGRLILEEVESYGEDSSHVWAARQIVQDLPDAVGAHVAPFEVDSGPHGVAYVLRGRIETTVAEPSEPVQLDWALERGLSGAPTVPMETNAVRLISPDSGLVSQYQGQKVRRAMALVADGRLVQQTSVEGAADNHGEVQWLGGPFDGPLVSVLRTESPWLIGRLTDGALVCARVDDKDGSKALTWTTLRKAVSAPPCVVAADRDHVDILAVSEGSVWHARLALEAPPREPLRWSNLGGNGATAVSAARARDGTLVVSTIAKDGVSICRWHAERPNDAPWISLGGPVSSHAIVTIDREERAVVAGLDRSMIVHSCDVPRTSEDVRPQWRDLGPLDQP